MRRIFRILWVAALAAGLVAVGSGIHALDLIEGSESAAPLAGGDAAPARVVHVVAGHVAVGLVGLVASIAFVLGLQGLLEAGGRRLPAALLFLLAPALAWLALAIEMSGRIDADAVEAGLLLEELQALRAGHATTLSIALGTGLAATAAAATWLLVRRRTDGDEVG